MENCVFCNIDKIRHDILFDSDNFFIKVGVGILAPGHVMIVSKQHLSCFGELPKELIEEFSLIKEVAFEKIKSNFSEPIIYEHGIYGQSVKHAHLHFIPANTKHYKLENIKEKFFTNLKSTRIKDMNDLIRIFQKEGSYLYLEEKGKKWVYHTSGHPEIKSLFRKEFARVTGIKGLLDWQAMVDEDKEKNNEWINLTKEFLQR